MEPVDVLRCIGELAARENRRDAARALARSLGANDLVIFVRDEAVGRSLPALGFTQTLAGSRDWRALIDRAIKDGAADGQVLTAEGKTHAWATGLRDGTVLVVLGAKPRDGELSVLRTVLRLVGDLLGNEWRIERAETEVNVAREAAAQAADLASKLDATRAGLRRALMSAETASRARDEFLATLSHELRTPLTSILGWTQFLDGEPDLNVIAEGLSTIARSARSQSRLIEDLLEFSRINAGKLRLDIATVDLIDVVRAAVEVTRPAADAKGIKVDVVLDPNAGPISGDPDRLQQVAWNLLSNAVKFTPREGKVQVRLTRLNSHAELSVCDTGQGIDAEFLPHVFDRFSQADGSSSRAHAGLGLGLSIVRHLVELHGGTIEASSEGIGCGSTFSVRLPVLIARYQTRKPVEALPALVMVPEPENVGVPTDLTGITVLLVEDNEDSRTIVTKILEKHGATVRAVENAAAALQAVAAKHPDVIVSDVEMPGEDGYSLMRAIRAMDTPARNVPAIALTAYARGTDRLTALEAGFQMHMAKPVEAIELVAAVKSVATSLA